MSIYKNVKYQIFSMIQLGIQPVQSCLTELHQGALSDKIELVEILVASWENWTSVSKNISVSPSQPQYYLYTFPKGVSSVVAQAGSDDDICATFSIQDIQCPVFDLDKNVKYTGMYQTMTYKAAISVEKENYPNGFYVVLVVPSSDQDCFELQKIRPASEVPRQKIISVIIEETIPQYEYIKGIMCAAGVFLGFYLVAAIIGLVYHGKGKFGCNIYVSNESADEEEPIFNGRATSYDSIDPNTAVKSLSANSTEPRNRERRFTDSIETDEIDFLSDAESETEVVRTKILLTVKDLSRKPRKRVYKTYRLYFLNLLTIMIFYGLPVIQLVLTYQQVLHQTGNEDICYYNFDCARPLGLISSFNNVFSNIGYIMLGALFLILVWRRDFLYQKAVQEKPELEQDYGIPQYYGLYYAMGAGLCMEGVMSACYHVCPNYSNFQFDTAFMYILACLCMLKIYQIRHPDVSAKAHSAYLMMALIIFVAVIGVLYGTKVTAFWIVLCVVHIVFSVFLTIEIYYIGRWNIDKSIFKRLWWTIKTDICRCTKPLYKGRISLLILGNAFNWGLAIYGAVTKPSDFASYFLAVFIGNLGLYTVFYIVMKLLNKERILPLTVLCIIIAFVTWGAGLYFFFAHLTSWQKTPAVSREGNKPCILLDFYDAHDVWHFLSAIGLFFSFLIYLTLDDDLAMIKRNTISVF